MTVRAAGPDGAGAGHSRQSEDLLLAVVRAVPDMISVFDISHGSMLWAGGGARELTGYSSAELVAMGPAVLDRLLPAADRPDLIRAIDRLEAAADGTVVEVRHRLRRRDGTLRWVDRRIVAFRRGPDGSLTHFLGIYRDVTDRVMVARELEHAAHHDPLTGLPNRRLADLALDEVLSATGDGPRRTGVLFCDVDDFKLINDTYGHDTGDKVLVEVGRRLARGVRPGDLVTRVGGDEFLVVLRGSTAHASPADAIADAIADAERAAQRIAEAVAHPTMVGTLRLDVTVSVGVAVADRGELAEDVVRRADRDMYRSKRHPPSTSPPVSS